MSQLAFVLAVMRVWQAHTYVYSFVGALLLSTLLIFLVLWRKGRLDMGEGPKFHMMNAEKDELQREGESHG